jgi:hypothetical protein
MSSDEIRLLHRKTTVQEVPVIGRNKTCGTVFTISKYATGGGAKLASQSQCQIR